MNISDLFTRVDKLTADETRKRLTGKDAEKIMLVDVREPAEYEEGHVPGAQFMPLSGLLNDMNMLDSSKTIITYCRRGPRSKSAGALLKRNGFQDVYYMDGGIDAWNGLVATGHYDDGLSLLEGLNSLEELITLAWSLEDGTGKFYEQVRDLSDDEDAKKTFESLVLAEQSHKSKIREACRQIKGDAVTEELIGTESFKGYMEGGVTVEETVRRIKEEKAKLQDILELTMQIETNSLDLYIKIMREVEDVSAKEIFNGLIEEEKTHLSRLGILLSKKYKIQVS